MEALYKNIRRRRLELGLSQEQLAEKTGYTSRTSIAKIESGKVNIPVDRIVQFADALDVPYAELAGWAGDAEGAQAPAPGDRTCEEIIESIEAGAYRPEELVQIISAASVRLSAMTKHL